MRGGQSSTTGTMTRHCAWLHFHRQPQWTGVAGPVTMHRHYPAGSSTPQLARQPGEPLRHRRSLCYTLGRFRQGATPTDIRATPTSDPRAASVGVIQKLPELADEFV